MNSNEPLAEEVLALALGAKLELLVGDRHQQRRIGARGAGRLHDVLDNGAGDAHRTELQHRRRRAGHAGLRLIRRIDGAGPGLHRLPHRLCRVGVERLIGETAIGQEEQRRRRAAALRASARGLRQSEPTPAVWHRQQRGYHSEGESRRYGERA